MLFLGQVIQAIPNAIGALCLNPAGQEQLNQRPSIIPGILAIFTSERHLKVLMDKENATLIGTAVDELIRHHPSLKMTVFDSMLTTFDKLEVLGSTWTLSRGQEHWYRLLAVSEFPIEAVEDDAHDDEPEPEDETEEDSASAMEGIEGGENASASTAAEHYPPPMAADDIIDDAIPYNSVVPCIDVFCRVRIFFQCDNGFAHKLAVHGRFIPTSTTLQGFHDQFRWPAASRQIVCVVLLYVGLRRWCTCSLLLSAVANDDGGITHRMYHLSRQASKVHSG
jgi:hypothetical protein